MSLRLSLSFLSAALLTGGATAQSPEQLEREQKILKDVKVPEGFEVTVFSAPPQSNYPVYAAASPDGTVYISSDKNGSLDRKEGRGSVIRLRDLDGDGRADEAKPFVDSVDSPRGLVWDHDRLYLMHPPHLSAFIDHNGDGIADEQKILVKDIAFGFKDRPADHTSNGVTLGVDGWLYLAIGDFGFMEAVGADGRRLQFRAGGVVRVRPDGTGLQVYSKGTRNILEVALSPLLEGFARDNTNDGGGWDMRFHHFTGFAEYGYPSLYMNFGEEIIQPIGNYGGGSGCGAGWLDEPGFPPGYQNVPLTVDWGKEWVYRHELSPNGGTFTDKAKEFIRLPRATDVDVDGMSRLYATSFAGATFNYNGEDVGSVIRVTPKGFKPEPMPDFAKLEGPSLVRLLTAPSHRRRLEAQRKLLRRGLDGETVTALEALALDSGVSMAGRTAAIFALAQGLEEKAAPFLTRLMSDAEVRPLAARALGDRGFAVPDESVKALIAALKDESARSRIESAVAIARLKLGSAAPFLTELLADPDPVVSHTAVRSLVQLEAAEACFAVVDIPGSTEPGRAGALRVLQQMHTESVVGGLLERFKHEGDAVPRRGLITALCRLSAREGVWKGDSWGTRPDTSGPYYQAAAWEATEAIAGAMRDWLAKAPPEEAAFLITEMSRHKMQDDAALAKVITMAGEDEKLIPMALFQLQRSARLPDGAMALLLKAAQDAGTQVDDRIVAVTLLAGTDSAEAMTAILTALTRMDAREKLNKASGVFLTSPKLENHHLLLETAAEKTGEPQAVWADAALLALASRTSGSPEARQLSQDALDKGWQLPARRAQILKAIVLTKHRAWSGRVLDALEDSDPEVLAAAQEAAKTLKLDRDAARAPKLATMEPDKVLEAVLAAKGDAAVGRQIFVQAGCTACHTVDKEEAQRGPFLGNIAETYKRRELAEAIAEPNKTLAQGFVTNLFELKDGTTHLGFVTTEAADKVVIRNVAAEEITLAAADIAKRDRLPLSLMPAGLMLNFTAADFASLLDYLESLVKK